MKATSLEQSKRLMKILPKETADLNYRLDEDGETYRLDYMPSVLTAWPSIPAWSLDGLVEALEGCRVSLIKWKSKYTGTYYYTARIGGNIVDSDISLVDALAELIINEEKI